MQCWFVSNQSDNMVEGVDSTPDFCHRSKKTISEMWMHFGNFKSVGGKLTEDVCRTCSSKDDSEGHDYDQILKDIGYSIDIHAHN